VHQLVAAAIIEPGIQSAAAQPEGNCRTEGEGRILAEIIVAGSVTHLDGVVLNRLDDAGRRHDFAAGKSLDLELAVGHVADSLGESLSAAIERIERLRKTRGEAPFELRRRLGDGGGGERCCSSRGKTSRSNKFSAIHSMFPPFQCRYACRLETAFIAGIFPVRQ